MECVKLFSLQSLKSAFSHTRRLYVFAAFANRDFAKFALLSQLGLTKGTGINIHLLVGLRWRTLMQHNELLSGTWHESDHCNM